MIKAVIVEDEAIAATRLKLLLKEINADVKIVAVLASVHEAIEYLSVIKPDLLFLDINLTDGSSFDIFKKLNINIPIIFTTAYSEYALKAFEQLSIDYLLKPIKKELLSKSIEKYVSLTGNNQNFDYDLLANALKNNYKKRFLVKINQQLRSIEISDVAYFFSEDKLSFIKTKEGYKIPLEHSLKNLESMLDPKEFFRINKKYLINHTAIKDMYYTSKSRVKLNLKPSPADENIFVAIEKLGTFKKWLST
jgi:two-component system response regulator LytT